MACLFRLIEIESGRICIDGIDIRDIGNILKDILNLIIRVYRYTNERCIQ